MSFSESFTSARSVNSKASTELLFGEVDKDAAQSLRSVGSLCNLIYTTDSRFFKFWVQEDIRNSFLSNLDKKDLANLRLVCHDFAGRAAPHFFKDISCTFKTRTFTNHASVATLDRIGSNVQTFTLKMPKCSQWDLPPLVDRDTGDQITFNYIPQPHWGLPWSRRISHPDYDCDALADMIVEQYPPLFHAATNVPSFIRAFNAMPNLKHLRVEFAEEQRSMIQYRSIVDYALISLRIALERAVLRDFDALSLLGMHEDSLLYFQPNLAYCSTPRSSKRWCAIKHLTLHLRGRDAPLAKRKDNLKILHSYLHTYPSLESLNFQWVGCRGPFPLSLHSEPDLRPVASRERGTMEIGLQRLKFLRLRKVSVQNVLIDASQISTFLSRHRRTLVDFNLEETRLRTGDWEQALAPMLRMAKRSRKKVESECESMEVPLGFYQEPEEIIYEQLGGGEDADEIQEERRSMDHWIFRNTSVKKATNKVKERLSTSDHLKKFVRLSSFAWR